MFVNGMVITAKRAAAIVIAAVAIFACDAYAQYGPKTGVNTVDPVVVRIDESKFLGVNVLGDYALVDSEGKELNLKEYAGKPTILVFSYYKCEGACATLNRDLANKLKDVKKLEPGSEYNVLTLSFDKDDDAVRTSHFASELGLDGKLSGGWRVARFKNQDDIKKATDSIGYKFFWSLRERLFVHPSVYVILSPDGRAVRYLYGAYIDSNDIEIALIEAMAGKSRASKAEDVRDLLLSACYSYNYETGKYTFNYPLLISAASLLLGVSLVFVGLIIKKKGKEGQI